MPAKRYEGRWFTVLMFIIILAGFVVMSLDTRGLAYQKDQGIDTGLDGVELAIFMIGLIMVFAGMSIRAVAIFTLKKNFSGRLRIRSDHTLVKNGIYRWVRHPAYLGAILLLVGIPVMLLSVLGTAVMLLLVPYLVHRSKLEERMMIERFGKEYEEYMKSSKRLVPFIY
jgi:protein-S-isoprenylcysteine O-methyltransferase Ste14